MLSRNRILGACALLVFAVLAVVVRGPVPTELDLTISRAIQSVSWLRIPMTLASIPGDGVVPYALATSTVVSFLALGRRLEARFLSVFVGFGAALNGAIKHLVARPRPTSAHVLKIDFVDGFSFPSGHVAFYVCFFGFLAVIALRRTKGEHLRRVFATLAITPIVLVPFSRVYLGAHWASDTLGALLWSTTWLAVVGTSYDAARAKTLV